MRERGDRAQHQPRAGEEHQREREVGDHECRRGRGRGRRRCRASHPPASAARRRGAAPRRHETEDHASSGRPDGGECQDRGRRWQHDRAAAASRARDAVSPGPGTIAEHNPGSRAAHAQHAGSRSAAAGRYGARPAPRTARRVSSRWRVTERASSRFATFAHAMSRTKPTAPSRTNRAARTFRASARRAAARRRSCRSRSRPDTHGASAREWRSFPPLPPRSDAPRASGRTPRRCWQLRHDESPLQFVADAAPTFRRTCQYRVRVERLERPPASRR